MLCSIERGDEKLSETVLTVYGVPASQPSRAVYWTCLIKGLAFELRTLQVLGDGESSLGEGEPGESLRFNNPIEA